MPQVAEAKQQLEAADVWDLVQCELGMMKFILEALSYIGVGPPPFQYPAGLLLLAEIPFGSDRFQLTSARREIDRTLLVFQRCGFLT